MNDLTITEHLIATREQTKFARDEPSHHYRQVITHILCAIENLAEATDKLHQKVNAQAQQRKEQSA